MSRSVVLLAPDGSDLYLTGVHPRVGPPARGFVENGGWNWERRGDEELAKSDNHIVNLWPARAYEVVEVTCDGNYNDVIASARRRPTS